MLFNLGAEHRCLLVVAGAGATKRFRCLRRGPSFEDVDSPRLDRVGRKMEVETTFRGASEPSDVDTAGEVRSALSRFDHEVSTHDDHHPIVGSRRQK